MKIFHLIALAHNWLADKDFLWWPFSFLRPEKNELMSFQHTLLMTGCFGGLTFLMFTVFAVVNNIFTIESAFYVLLFSLLGLFFWFNVITRPLWNYRARLQMK